MAQYSDFNVAFRKDVYEGITLMFKASHAIEDVMTNISKLYNFYMGITQSEASKRQIEVDFKLLTQSKKFAKSAFKGLTAEYPSEALEQKVQSRYKELQQQLSHDENLQKRSSELFEAFQAHAKLRKAIGKPDPSSSLLLHPSEKALRWFLDLSHQKIFNCYFWDCHIFFYDVILVELFYKRGIKLSPNTLQWGERTLFEGRNSFHPLDSHLIEFFNFLIEFDKNPKKLLQHASYPEKEIDPLEETKSYCVNYPEKLHNLIKFFNACEGTTPEELVLLLIAIGAKPESIWTAEVKAQKASELPSYDLQKRFEKLKEIYEKCLNSEHRCYGGRTDGEARTLGINPIDDYYKNLFVFCHENLYFKKLLLPPPHDPID